MPTYQFLCHKCKKVFELTYAFTEYERKKKQGIKCTECRSSKVVQLIPAFQVQTSKKS